MAPAKLRRASAGQRASLFGDEVPEASQGAAEEAFLLAELLERHRQAAFLVVAEHDAEVVALPLRFRGGDGALPLIEVVAAVVRVVGLGDRLAGEALRGAEGVDAALVSGVEGGVSRE